MQIVQQPGGGLSAPTLAGINSITSATGQTLTLAPLDIDKSVIVNFPNGNTTGKFEVQSNGTTNVYLDSANSAVGVGAGSNTATFARNAATGEVSIKAVQAAMPLKFYTVNTLALTLDALQLAIFEKPVFTKAGSVSQAGWAGGSFVLQPSGTNTASLFDDNSINCVTLAAPVFSRYILLASSAGVVATGGPIASASAFSINGLIGAATTGTQHVKPITAIANATATGVLTITVPNAAHAATVRITLHASLGTSGGASPDIANQATACISYDIALARLTGLNAVAAISAAFGSSGSATVAGGNSCTVTAALSAVTGGVGVSNTFTVNATISRGAGASTNHTCLVKAEILNSNATGITLS